jgi:HEAT repeat protein
LNRIYSASLNATQVSQWIDELVSCRGSDRHERSLRIADSGKPLPIDRPSKELRWNERAIVMEDAAYALALAGEEAIEPLCDLFELADPWVSINACFALGEIGNAAAISTLIAALHDPHQQVVRQALDALGVLGHSINDALPAIESLLTSENAAWQKPEVMRGWTAQDQIRLNAVFALLNVVHLTGSDLQTIEHILIHALDDANGYVPEVACEALRRINTPSAIAAAFKHLQQRRWDPSLLGRQKIY